MKKFNQLWLKKQKLLKTFLSSIKTEVAIKFAKKTFFFSTENRLGAEKVKTFASIGRTGTSKGKVEVRAICLNISFMTGFFQFFHSHTYI